MKVIFKITATFLLLNGSIHAQTVTEKVVPLSKKAIKGYFFDVDSRPDGTFDVIYKFKEGKDNITYETYSFDANLNLKSQEESSVSKKKTENKPDYNKTVIYSWVGGCTSFDILSMKLHISKAEFEYKWNPDRKEYKRRKLSEKEIILNDAGEAGYKGYAYFANEENGEAVIVASTERAIDKKTKVEDFILLHIDNNQKISKTPVTFDHKQVLVYAAAIPNKTDGNAPFHETDDLYQADLYLIFAPQKGSSDNKKYTLLRVNSKGEIVVRNSFQSPSGNLVIMSGLRNNDGSIMFVGAHTAMDRAYDEVFKDYAPLSNPCYTGYANYKMEQYETKLMKEKMSSFCVLKFANDKMEWIKSNDINAMAEKIITPPGQKKSPFYAGNRFKVMLFGTLPNGDYMLSGQILGRDKKANILYGAIVCLQIDKSGNVVAQYGITPASISSDVNKLYPIPQQYYSSPDKRNVYWSLLETKVLKGYEDFYDAYVGKVTYYPNYYPTFLKFDPVSKSISDYKILGGRKYLVYKSIASVYNEKNNSVVYFGYDKGKNLWLCKYDMN